MKKKTLNHHASDRSAGAKASSYFFESQQTTEQPLTRVEQAFRCRYAYGRAAETVVLAEKGQDYLAFAVDDNVCSFVLCDGVGLSYQGDFASRFLGSGLLGWLRKGQDLSRQQLDRKLMELTQAAAAEAASFHIDERTPQLLREVLQEKQRKGSEAMYICGRIELPGRFQRKGNMWLAWQGDSRLRLFQQCMELTSQFGARFHTSERWSTRNGPIGSGPHVYECRLEQGKDYRLLMYSDGLNDLDPISEPVPDEDIQVLMSSLHTGGLEDDASFLEISW